MSDTYTFGEIMETMKDLEFENKRLKQYLNWLDDNEMPTVGYDEWCVDCSFHMKGKEDE